MQNIKEKFTSGNALTFTRLLMSLSTINAWPTGREGSYLVSHKNVHAYPSSLRKNSQAGEPSLNNPWSSEVKK